MSGSLFLVLLIVVLVVAARLLLRGQRRPPVRSAGDPGMCRIGEDPQQPAAPGESARDV